MINNEYLSYAARILADTNEGLSGSEICKFCNQYACLLYTSCDEYHDQIHGREW